MPKLTIDQREIEVPPGTTVLGAARMLGIEIPKLCYLEGCDASTSCLVCVVKINGNARLVPACATVVQEGMTVESETDEVRAARRTALELLLSDHLGDCLAPCYFACPAEMDIPVMLRQIAAGDLRGAIATVKRDIALPAVLGRICPAPCEKACRRHGLDGAVSICQLKRFVADADLASPKPFLPPCNPASGKRVAIVGGGPSGLAAAYYLTQAGHACTIFDENESLGGRLWKETSPEQLPHEVLSAEIAQITRLGIEVRAKTKIDSAGAFAAFCKDYDAVLIAAGSDAKAQADTFGVAVGPKGIHVEHGMFRTDRAGVFAAGTAVRGKSMIVRSTADGKEAAVTIDQFLQGLPVTGYLRPFSTKIGRMEGEELIQFADRTSQEPRTPPANLDEGYDAESAISQSARCLHCDCRGLHTCKLRKYAVMYGADTKRFKTGRRVFTQDTRHAEIIFEPGKCIDCGLCIQIAAVAGEKIGLTFVGRGFDVRVAVPLDRPLSEALQKAAADCVAACPTAALAWKES